MHLYKDQNLSRKSPRAESTALRYHRKTNNVVKLANTDRTQVPLQKIKMQLSDYLRKKSYAKPSHINRSQELYHKKFLNTNDAKKRTSIRVSRFSKNNDTNKEQNLKSGTPDLMISSIEKRTFIIKEIAPHLKQTPKQEQDESFIFKSTDELKNSAFKIQAIQRALSRSKQYDLDNYEKILQKWSSSNRLRKVKKVSQIKKANPQERSSFGYLQPWSSQQIREDFIV